MAVLSDTDRFQAHRNLMNALSRRTEVLNVLKVDLKAAVDAADLWVDNNRASFNSALPVAAQSGLTAKQKAELLVVVVERRFNIL